MKPRYLRAVDSKETREVLREFHYPPHELSVQSEHWLSTPHDESDTFKYIYVQTPGAQDFGGRNGFIPLKVKPCNLQEKIDDYKCEEMYTLPDFYPASKSRARLHGIDKFDEWTEDSVLDELYDAALQPEREQLMNKLRNSSRYITTEKIYDHKHPGDDTKKKASKVLDTGPDNFEEPFKAIISDIRRRIMQRPNDDDI